MLDDILKDGELVGSESSAYADASGTAAPLEHDRGVQPGIPSPPRTLLLAEEASQAVGATPCKEYTVIVTTGDQKFAGGLMRTCMRIARCVASHAALFNVQGPTPRCTACSSANWQRALASSYGVQPILRQAVPCMPWQTIPVCVCS